MINHVWKRWDFTAFNLFCQLIMKKRWLELVDDLLNSASLISLCFIIFKFCNILLNFTNLKLQF